ncbi:MAG: polyphosphate kinase 1 [Pseudomonadota bacterium]
MLPKQTLLLNREIGILEFNRRVLAQAEDADTPLLERLRFLCIVSNNLDEFFEIRVAELKETLRVNLRSAGLDGMSPGEVFTSVSRIAHDLVERQYRLLNEKILPELEKSGVRFLRRNDLNQTQRAWIRDYFFNEMMPVLTPIGLDPVHPFPRVFNKSLNFAVELEGRDAFGRASRAAIVQAPRILPRVIKLPRELRQAKEQSFVFLSSVLHEHASELFAGMSVRGCYQFRVTRNSNLFVDEEEVKNLRTALQGELPQRNLGAAVRLEVADNCTPAMAEFLLQQTELGPEDLYRVNGPVNLVRLMQIPELVDRPDLQFPAFRPGRPAALEKRADIFAAVRRGDVLLHHPFQSFTPVVNFIQQAAKDPQVVAIKQTVYRIGTDSAIMEALIEAAGSGKEVTVVVELMARFEEVANINWAERLEEVGAHVVYGVVAHKTHAKMVLVVRREDGKLRRYVHLGTGNYHPRTARLYTDFGLFSCNQDMCADVNEVFKQLTGLGKSKALHHLWLAPFTLHAKIIAAIKNEIRIARAGKPARIIAKMNALLEPTVIEALYAASKAGVRVDLVVRGVCALRPGVPGLSETIRVRSIIGRFLEHSRIFYFFNAGAENVYLSSADWMDRNFFRRVELCFPLLENKLKQRVIKEGLKPYLKDNRQAWDMNADGHYQRKNPRGTLPRSAQLMQLGELARE